MTLGLSKKAQQAADAAAAQTALYDAQQVANKKAEQNALSDQQQLANERAQQNSLYDQQQVDNERNAQNSLADQSMADYAAVQARTYAEQEAAAQNQLYTEQQQAIANDPRFAAQQANEQDALYDQQMADTAADPNYAPQRANEQDMLYDQQMADNEAADQNRLYDEQQAAIANDPRYADQRANEQNALYDQQPFDNEAIQQNALAEQEAAASEATRAKAYAEQDALAAEQNANQQDDLYLLQQSQNMADRNKGMSDSSEAADPKTARLASDLTLQQVAQGNSTATSATSVTYANNGVTDWRVKVSVGSGSSILYEESNAKMLAPIRHTGGFIFPISPQVQMTHTAKYSAQSLTHSNYAMQFYEGSEVGPIQINGEFPVQTVEEGRYLLAAIHFFRAATKMYWAKDKLAGTPPPMVFLTGFGEFYFPKVPCVITSFMHTMPEDKDFIEIPPPEGINGLPTRLPTQSTVALILQPIYSRESLTQFSVEDLANGRLLGKGGFI